MKDLTKGSPSKVMISFAIPVALGNIFQLCYSLADTRVVGSTLGEAALAAVGATTSISTLFIGFLSGLTNGFALLIARQFGAGDKKGVTRYGAGCLLLGCITSVLLTFICVSSLPFILRLLNVPEALMGQSTAYIRAVLLGLLATMLYNGCASILRLWAIPLRPFIPSVCSSTKCSPGPAFHFKVWFWCCRRCLGHRIVPVTFRHHKSGLHV